MLSIWHFAHNAFTIKSQIVVGQNEWKCARVRDESCFAYGSRLSQFTYTLRSLIRFHFKAMGGKSIIWLKPSVLMLFHFFFALFRLFDTSFFFLSHFVLDVWFVSWKIAIELCGCFQLKSRFLFLWTEIKIHLNNFFHSSNYTNERMVCLHWYLVL